MSTTTKKYLTSTALALLLLVSACDKPQDEKVAQENAKTAQVIQNPPMIQSIPSRSVAGNYLAARFAIGSDDLNSASTFFERAISNSTDNQDFLIERALPAAIGAGDMDQALQLAKGVDIDKPVATSQLAVTFLLVDAFKNNDTKTINELLPKLRADGFGRLLKPLMEVWADVGQNNSQKAIKELNDFTKAYPSLAGLTDLHLAYIYDYGDNKADAEKYYTKTLSQSVSVRSVWIVGQFFERTGDTNKAIQLYTELANKLQGSPFAQIVVKRIQSGRLDTDKFITAPKDGVAAALYDVATVLHQESSSRLAILYAQMAYELTPDDPFINLLLGDIISSTNQPDAAEGFYQSVEKDNDLYVLAQFRLAQFYELKGDLKKAIDILKDMAKDDLVKRQALTEIADIHRRQENFAEAIPYYTDAIDMIEKPVESDWTLFYARGICYERAKQWDKAEADLQHALELSPQQPEVLNYLAYSWADSGKNSDQALDMLQKALASAPDDPYITDSVGWALYKVGRYSEAVPYLEAAIQQLPEDTTINDHLGDIYWHVGRKLEAQFQWKRALKNVNAKDIELKQQLESKVKNGYPQPGAPKVISTNE